MLIIDQTNWHFVLYGMWAVGIILIFIGATWLRWRRFVIVGLIVPGVATAIIMPKVIQNQMDVYVATEINGKISVMENLGISGGHYKFSSEKVIPLPEPSPTLRAVIVNHTGRELRLVQLGNARNKWRKSPKDKMVLKLTPEAIKGIATRVDFTGQDGVAVKTLKGREIFDERHWLTWD
ncbi:MAG: hypothetical protein HOB79_18110 [Rhodospirillaceae bacterium]|jgi:hypothetical protein|nr:hypothetical protein [Rhodospirillales bacterium]MBT3904914.1 hypothetical protein [Rhodospirillaceae bacterium]MBT4702991.1 hypothetical protein [Rhodospirillaceae bacterium]MBT5033020.1 hypothetical protein [Rhodospirillaceae bacterium]MBT6218103.1 hypothetical protein [Rhodospirillaceae bacterium]